MPASTIVVLSCDVMALIVEIILLYALLFENSERDKKTQYFAMCCICTILSLATDIPAWFYEGKPGHDFMLYVTNTLALVFSLGAVAYISFYEIEIIGRKDNVSTFHAKFISFVCFATAIFIVIGVITGKTFSIKNGVFVYGPWYSVTPVVSLVLLAYMETLAVIKWKYLGTHSTIAFLTYMILPLIAAIIEAIYPQVSLALAATGLAALLLYVMLQSGHVSQLHMRGELLKELTYKDMLTELQNRRAYDLMLDGIAPDTVINFIFCDVNGLKYVNDTHGHAAGDERLKRFSSVLKKHFSRDSLFRISGDEFVVIIPDLKEDVFNVRVQRLKDELTFLDDLAAVGSSSGFGKDAKSLISLAEERMYENKKESYIKHPEHIR